MPNHFNKQPRAKILPATTAWLDQEQKAKRHWNVFYQEKNLGLSNETQPLACEILCQLSVNGETHAQVTPQVRGCFWA